MASNAFRLNLMLVPAAVFGAMMPSFWSYTNLKNLCSDFEINFDWNFKSIKSRLVDRQSCKYYLNLTAIEIKDNLRTLKFFGQLNPQTLKCFKLYENWFKDVK
jgi:hypothetical protein